MTTLLDKLRRRLERDRDVPWPERIRDSARAAVSYGADAARAQAVLRDCDAVGAWTRAVAGSPYVDNRGRIEIGSHVQLISSFSPVQLTTEPGGLIRIGDRTVINFGTLIRAHQEVTLGDDVSIGPYCILADHAAEARNRTDEGTAPIALGDGVWLAGRVTILPGCSIGKGSVITAGSIVTSDIPPGVVAGGIPARVLRRIDGAQQEAMERAAASDAALDAHATNGATTEASAATTQVITKVRVEEPRGACVPVAHAPREGAHTALVISDFTADAFAARLTEDGEAPLVDAELAPFGQVVPSLMQLASESTPPSLVVVWTRPQTAIASFQRVLAYEHVDEAVLLAEVEAFAKLIGESTRHVKCVVVPTWTLPAYNRGWGLMDAKASGATRALMAMNLRLMDAVAAFPNVHVVNAQRWVESAGKQAQNPKLWYMGKVAFHVDAFEEAVRDAKAALTAVTQGPRKLVVVDLDDTLWGGIVGDAGWENLRLGGHDSLGEAFVDFQQALKNLKRRGILLAIASKNEESVALEAIRSHPEMVLRENDFVAWRINWQDKAANIVEIARELNLGLQSVVFLDDNPVERGRVREQLPEVLVPEWPEDKLLYASTLLNLRCFDAPTITQEDAERSEMYVGERLRAALLPQVGSMDEWVRSLELKVRAAKLSPSNAPRAAQLLNKTNQLNLRTRRLAQNELEDWVKDPSRDLFVVNVADKYGDSGLTGIVSVEQRGDTVHVIDYVLSCRVMGRKVEETLVHLAVESARRRGASQVRAELLPTAKNKPTATFWEQRSGFDKPEPNMYVWDATRPYEKPEQLELAIEGA